MTGSAEVRDLFVDAMTTRLVGVPATPEAHQWLDRTAVAVANEHLSRALSGALLPRGHWFLPRLDLVLSYSGLDGLPALENVWSRAIIESITTSLGSDGGWVHFATDTDLVAAMIVGAATGATDHDWVWTQAGLPVQALASGAATDVVVAALELHPQVAVAALIHAAHAVGVPALDRALGDRGWCNVGRVLGAPLLGSDVQDDPIQDAEPGAPVDSAHPSEVSEVPEAAPEHDTTVEPTLPGQGVERATAVLLLETSSVGRLFLESRIRPSRPTATVWAWLVIAEVEPALLRALMHLRAVRELIESRLAPRPDHADRPAAVPAPAQRPAVPTSEPPRPAPAAGDKLGAPTAQPSTRDRFSADRGVAYDHLTCDHPPDDRAVDGGANGRSASTTAGGPRETPTAAQLESLTSEAARASDHHPPAAEVTTAWAGLLFLLATARGAGLPECVAADPVLAVRGVRWSAWCAGVVLTHERLDDPAVLALGGLGLGQAALVLDQPPATSVEVRAVARLAARWRRLTLARLFAAPLGGEQIPASRAHAWAWLTLRPGTVRADPGWIDIVMPLSSVDVAIRSAGLDLNPGFVPWLGTVVELRYE